MTKKRYNFYWVFRDKQSGYVTISRHNRPDFVATLTNAELEERWDRIKVDFPIGKFDTDLEKKVENETLYPLK